MIKRIAATLGALIIAAAVLVGFSTPANAASTSSCLNYNSYNTTTCANVTWIRDGNRIVITSFGLSTTKGCGSLNASPRYFYFDVDHPTKYFHYAGQDCNFSKGVYHRSGSDGKTIINIYSKANTNGWTDVNLGWQIQLQLDGNAVVLWKNADPGNGSCC